jgi:DNA-directed RNA polymerase specialized sigma24 family protein
MGYQDQTDIGGVRDAFFTTHWSLIEGVKKHQDRDQVLIGLLIERYWKPVYCYLRRKGYQNEQAKDLTQSFFHEVVLNRRLVERADSAKGRFRSFLLHALGQFLISQKRKEGTRLRIPKEKLVPLDVIEPPELPQAVLEGTPEDCFIHSWKSTLLDQALSEVQSECRAQGIETHWNVFRDRVVQPIIEGNKPPSYQTMCNLYGIESESKLSNMIVTVKRRFKAALKRQLRATVLSEDDVTPELHEMLSLFRESAQDLE